MNDSAVPGERTFPNPEALASELAEAIAKRLDAAVAARGSALLAVSGGRSPKLMFEHLSRIKLPWSSVIVTLVDERWVDADHADSNAKLVRENLLVNAAAAARLLPMKNNAATPEAGRDACETDLRALPLPFDVVVLGMGDDGHTASLFPEAAELGAALNPNSGKLCSPMHPPKAPQARMTLTLQALLNSRILLLQISGAAKMATYKTALGPGPVEQMPVRAVLRQRQVPVEVWYSETA